MNQSEQNNSQIYASTYELLYGKLTEGMKKRVLAVKADPTIRDTDVEMFIRDVISMSEDIMARNTTIGPDLK